MYRQVRAEYIKHRTREYVRAAEAIGVTTPSACSCTSCRT